MRADFTVLTDQRLHTLDIGGIELCEGAVFNDKRHDRVLVHKAFKNVRIGGIARFCFLLCRQTQVLEKHLTKLFCGSYIELLACIHIYLRGKLVYLYFQVLAESLYALCVCLYAVKLH